MAKRVRDIAEELHISKQAVYQRMNAIKDFKKNYTQRVGNHIVISDEGINELNKNINQNNKDINQLIDETNGVILKQLKIKDKQLDAKDKQILNLQRALDQQQRLQLASDNRAKDLEKRLKRLTVNNESKFNDDIDESAVKPKNEKPKKEEKKGFWSRIFK